MLEESISASPEIRNKSQSHNIGIHKKKRRRLNHRKSNLNFDPSSVDKTNCIKELNINDLYYNELPENIVKVFNNPLEDERLLMLADKTMLEARRKFDRKYTTQCFQKFDDIVANEVEEPILDTTVNATIIDPELQFGISESELLQVCEEIEEDNNLIKSPTTENRNSVVQSILDDFDCLGCSPSPSRKKDSIDSTPRFQFKSKSIKTYSRHKTIPSSNNLESTRNKNNSIVCKLENVYESDSTISDMSDISVQIDLTENTQTNSERININNSFSVVDNLLSLSKYYEQTYDPNTDFEDTLIKMEIEEINSYSQKVSQNSTVCEEEVKQLAEKNVEQLIENKNENWKFKLKRDVSGDEFYGFENYEMYIFKKSPISENLRNKENENSPLKLSQVYLDSVLSDVNKMLEETDKHLSLKKDFKNDESKARNCSNLFKTTKSTNFKQERISLLAIPHSVKMSPSSSPSPSSKLNNSKIENLLDDCHSWDDTDFDNVFSSAVPSPAAINGILNIEDVSWSEDFPTVDKDVAINGTKLNNNILVTNENVAFKTASSKSIQISEKAQRKARCFLEDFEKAEHELESKINDFDGFKTGKSKPISISEKAKQKAAAFLRKFEEVERSLNEVKSNKTELENIISANNVVTEDKLSVSFTTASKKPIVISEEAMEKASRLILEAEDDPLPGPLEEESNTFIHKRKYFEMLSNQPHSSLEKNSRILATSGMKSNSTSKSTSRTPFNPLENCATPTIIKPISKILTTPLSRQPSGEQRSIPLSRRNPLSLSKRKFCVPSSTVCSPNKSINSSPKLEEFFSAVSTSTPRINKLPNSTIVREVSKLIMPVNDNCLVPLEEDNDFKRIQWNDSTINKSNRTENSFNQTSNNVSITELSPSPKMRYERLKMYGRPSALSPILMTDQCRASGLKRSRNFEKNT